MSLQEQITAIATEREAIQTRQKIAHQRMDEAARQLTAAMAERNRLQVICTEFEKTGEHIPPYEQFAKASLAADRAAEQLEMAEKDAQSEDLQAREKLSMLNQQETEARRDSVVAEFHAAVVSYEKIIQTTRLAFLGDEIRRLAALAAIRLEERSPLFDDDWLTIGNYPLNIRCHSSAEGNH